MTASRLLVLATIAFSWSLAIAAAPAKKAPPPVPATVMNALKKAKIPLEDLSLAAIPLDGKGPVIRFQAERPRTPASVEKIVTSAAALHFLGPAKQWVTRVWADAEPVDGVLNGPIYISGRGDATLNIERFWLLLEDLRARGIHSINGNIVVDRSFFKLDEHDPFAFDGEGNRPYNLGPDALMVNYRSFLIRIEPDRAKGVAYLRASPELSTVKLPTTVPLAKGGCDGWRKKMRPDFSNPSSPQFLGAFPSSCGPKTYVYTAFEEDAYLKALFAGLWKNLGGTWSGNVVAGKPADEKVLVASTTSEPLTQVLYRMNKFSNNIIARQLFLAIGQTDQDEPKTLAASRQTLQSWTDELKIPPKQLYVDNGSGLSRRSVLSAQAAVQILKAAWEAPWMPEFVSSLPISGVDGTMRKRKVATGWAHIKTGYISEVRSIAGYVKTEKGRQYAIAAIVNGKGAIRAIPVMDAFIQWVRSRC